MDNYSIPDLCKLSVLSTLLFLTATGCSRHTTTEPASPTRLLTISFPDLPLTENELVQSITLEFECGRVVALNPMPADWSATLYWSATNCCSLSAEAGHFSGGLRNLRPLDHAITILAGHPTRFEIKASINAQSIGNETSEGSERTFDLTEKDLRLEPAPTPPASLSVAIAPTPIQDLPAEWLQPFVPNSNRTANESGKYIVHKRDTLDQIAASFHLSTNALLALNPELDPTHLTIGQVISVTNRNP